MTPARPPLADRHPLSNVGVIAGIGHTDYVRGTRRSTLELQLEASLTALEDAGLSADEVDAVIPNSVSGRAAEEFIDNLGLKDLKYSATHHTGGASVISSIQTACMAVATGQASVVLVPAGRRGYSGERVSAGRAGSPVRANIDEFEAPHGHLNAMQWFAQAATRHMYETGLNELHLAEVALTMRRHAQLNPGAYFHGRPMTLEDYLGSGWVSTPFRRFDCSLETDGAAAVVITGADRAADLPKPAPRIRGIAQGHAYPSTSLIQKADLTVVEGLAHAGRRAFEMAGVRPADIDLALLYDATTWFVLVSLEILGFCERGAAGEFVAGGRIALSGDLPVNPHGGLLSEAHVSGMNHVVEAVRQLRGEVPTERRVADAELALVSNEGHFFEGAVMILEAA
ncbi:thiolase C-terminal domain-containing protein [Enemella sp. A6]|uniref:thiolase C-terminal domain-containing protein n=1 Tax=Enemella sp. A6 TaxID=3440152 RepID=UPI003EBC5EBA